MKPSKLQIKEGHYYARRDGSVHGPAIHRGVSTIWPWLLYDAHPGEGYKHYKSNGAYVDRRGDFRNLVREVPAPHAKPAKAKARKREMVNVYLFICAQFQFGQSIHAYDNRTEARKDLALMRESEFVCGPITKISIPAPSGKGET